jgi:hypothetical protein
VATKQNLGDELQAAPAPFGGHCKIVKDGTIKEEEE